MISRGGEAVPPELGVVIPTLDEEETLPHLLEDLDALPVPVEVVVADGGSRDRTLEAARKRGVRTVRTSAGRGRQMNAGARTLASPWILFLHADSRLPRETRDALLSWLSSSASVEAAHFRFRLDRDGLWWSLIERGQRIRERLTGLTYGDQGLLISRTRYERVGGFPEIPVMEDVEVVRRLRRDGGLDRIGAPLITSARRYESEGPVRACLRNLGLILLYSLSVRPDRLARWYRPRSG